MWEIMSLKTKLFLIVIMVVFIIVAICIIASRHFLLTSASLLESEQIIEDINRIKTVIKSETKGMGQIVKDWAAWDATYSFVERDNESYRQENLTPSLLKDLDVNLFLIANKSGQVLYWRFESEENVQFRFEQFAREWLKKDDAIFASLDPGWAGGGMIVFNGMPILIVSMPVLTSNNEGPAKGWVVMGRLMNKARLRSMCRIAGVSFSIIPLGQMYLHPFPGGFIEKVTKSDQPVAYNMGNIIYGFCAWKNLRGVPDILFVVQKERSLYKQAIVNARFVSLWFLLLAFAIISFSLWLIEKFVIIPLGNSLKVIRRGIAGITLSRDLSGRVTSSHKNEFGEITSAINKMLDELEKAQKENEINRQNIIRLDKLASLGTLVSGIAHEINNPNAVIRANAEVIIDLFNDITRMLNEKARTNGDFKIGRRSYSELQNEIPLLLGEIKDASTRIAEMINELKQFSRPPETVLVADVFINEVVKSAITILRSHITKYTLSLIHI